jgi:hypothetical protein
MQHRSGEETMAYRSVISGIVSGVAMIMMASRAADAQIDNMVPPVGSLMWHYECKAGAQCPTRCTVKGTELFSTGNFQSLTILQIPNQVYWIRVNTGQANVDYVVQADQVACSISGATLMSAKSAPRP